MRKVLITGSILQEYKIDGKPVYITSIVNGTKYHQKAVIGQYDRTGIVIPKGERTYSIRLASHVLNKYIEAHGEKNRGVIMTPRKNRNVNIIGYSEQYFKSSEESNKLLL